MQAIILAGGKGTRLKPYTLVLPKPLMPIGDMTILEVLIRQLRAAAFDDLVLSVGYLKDLLQAFVGNSRLGPSIRLVTENEPLGTAGSIPLVPDLERQFLVINGDTLTTLDFRKFMEFHEKSGAMATIATHIRENPVDFGVLECDSRGELLRYIEKPVHTYQVSMGVNAFSADVLSYLERGKPKDIPQLIQELLDDGQRVVCYKTDSFWLDIGRLSDFEKAVEIFQERRADFLGDNA